MVEPGGNPVYELYFLLSPVGGGPWLLGVLPNKIAPRGEVF